MTTTEQSAASPEHEPAPQLRSRRDRHPRSKLGVGRTLAIAFALLVNGALVFAIGWALTHPQRITDQFAVWQFEPDATIEAYADRSAMTDEGEFLFFASKPEVSADDAFDEVCGSTAEEEFGVLGCYLPGPQRIYLYDVTDDRLDGMEEVVASHEMLHAVWDRLAEEERETLAPLLEAEASRLEADEAFAERLELYARIEPGERLNELHSIVGTEIGEVSPALEEHYARYLGNRSALVALHESSHAVFLEHQAQIEALVAEMTLLSDGVDVDYAAYNAGYDQLNADIDSFNARADRGDFSSQSQFNRERNALLARQAELDAAYETIQARVAEFDALGVQLEELNAEVDELNASINIAPPRTPES